MGKGSSMKATPRIEENWALFLDLDGTLLDIAPSPDQVVVPSDLVSALTAIKVRLSGALAIVSGRPFAEIDELLRPMQLSGGAEHGAFIRDAQGQMRKSPGLHDIPDAWRRELHSATKRWSGVQVEEKSQSIVLHFRQAPDRDEDLKRLAATLVERDPTHFHILHAKMAYEIRPRGTTKGGVVAHLMNETPFSGRVPVFVGDDVTDEDGMMAARMLGGHGLHVHEEFAGEASNVRSWLAEGAETQSE